MLELMEIRTKTIPIAKKYDVTSMEIFGSYANGTANPDSDVDFLVEFSASVPSIFEVMGLREELKMALGVEVDVVTRPFTNPARTFIDRSEKIL